MAQKKEPNPEKIPQEPATISRQLFGTAWRSQGHQNSTLPKGRRPFPPELLAQPESPVIPPEIPVAPIPVEPPSPRPTEPSPLPPRPPDPSPPNTPEPNPPPDPKGENSTLR